MSEDDLCCSTQLIDGNGEFSVEGLEKFVKRVRLAEYGLSYAVVSIMGPQRSGKSTLLNHLFNTNFREMDAFAGRSQTTKGVWIARSPGIEPCTIIMDLEGTDGRERGEDDTTFEKQSALFALAISGIVLINMWCHDISREQAANRPLLKTVFQVMMRLFTPRKTTLLFVIRDKTKTPLEYLEPVLREDIQKIWDSIPKPQVHKHTLMSEFFNVEVTALASYEENEELFKKQVAQLRQRFFHPINPRGLAGDRRGVVPASGFSVSAHQIWRVIRENKDLDLPAHKVMVATVRGEEIANGKLLNMTSNQAWLELEAAVQAGLMKGFGKKVDLVLDTLISEYDAGTIYFDEGVRTSKRQQLQSGALQRVYPAFQTMLRHLRHISFENFKKELEQSLKNGKGFALSVNECTSHTMNGFERGFTDVAIQRANWDGLKTKEKLRQDIETHADSVCSAKLSELKSEHEKKLYEALAIPMESLFDSGDHDIWLSIGKLYTREMENVLSSFLSSLSGFELDQVILDLSAEELRNYARSVVESKARQEAGKVLIRMKDRFTTVFSHDNDSMPRVWTGKEDIRAITKNAQASALKLLSALTVIRLNGEKDNIENILQYTLLEKKGLRARDVRDSNSLLSASTWDGINPKNMLISPVQCESIWKQFNWETEYIVTQAISTQEAYKRNNNWLPPPWAILAIAILGFNEFMMLLRNPFYIMVLFILYLLTKALWVQLDISGEFRHGPFSGLLALSARFLPTVMNLLRKLADLGQIPHRPSTSYFQSFRSQTPVQNTIANSMSASSSLSTLSSNNAESESTGSVENFTAADLDQESTA